MQIATIDINKLRGVGDKFVGLAKEFTGVLLGNDSLQKSGEAQQGKATETLKLRMTRQWPRAKRTRPSRS